MNQLKSDLEQYETQVSQQSLSGKIFAFLTYLRIFLNFQLSQIQLAISASPEEADKENLLSLETDMKELIKLTRDSLQELVSKENDPLADEYDLFKVKTYLLGYYCRCNEVYL